MRIVLHEMRKIWNLKIVLVLALLCALYYLIFLSVHIDYFRTNHSQTEEVDYAAELVKRYGPTLEADEYAEFVRETREELKAEMEAYIRSSPVFAAAGIHSFEDYERVYEKTDRTEAEDKAVWALLGEEAGFVRFRLQALEKIEASYHNFTEIVLPRMLEDAANEKERDRIAAVMETEEYRNIMEWWVYDNTIAYTLDLAVLSVLAVLVLVSPLIVGDRARKVHLLQYSAKEGRRILGKQLAAVLLSAFLLTTLLLAVFGAIYSKNGTWVFFDSGLTSFLNGSVFWFGVTYGQYVLSYAGMLYVLSLGTAALAFLLSRHSRNLITLILKLIPLFAALAFFCVLVFRQMFGLNNILYRWTMIPGIEPAVCVFVCMIGVAAALRLVRREQKTDVADGT